MRTTCTAIAAAALVALSVSSSCAQSAGGLLTIQVDNGGPPFGSRPLAEAVVAHLQEEPEALASGLSTAILQGLAKAPEDRPPTATAYALMLRVSLS